MFTKQAKTGFTLIELLVVVLIIGILAGVALPQYRKAVAKARLTEAIQLTQKLRQEIDLYVLENGYGAPYGVDVLGGDSTPAGPKNLLDVESAMDCTAGDSVNGYKLCSTKHFGFFGGTKFIRVFGLDPSATGLSQLQYDRDANGNWKLAKCSLDIVPQMCEHFR